MAEYVVIQLARFGDILQTKRLILSLMQRGRVHLCVDQALEDLARLVYPDIVVHSLPLSRGNPLAVLEEGKATLATLRAIRPDEVYALNHVALCRALVRLFPPEIVRGYPVASGQALRSAWVNLAFRWMACRKEAPLNLVDFWAALAPNPLSPELVNPQACAGGEGLGVVMAGQHARRSLPPEVLAPLVHAAFYRLGASRIRLFGGKADHGAAQKLLSCLPASVAQHVEDLTGRTNWNALANALTGLDLLLSPDTGTAHFAAHLGVPVEGLFLSSAWAFETGPYGRGHRVWQAVEACSPCTESSPCARHTACLAPFRSASFLARMQGRKSGAAARPLEGMIVLDSDFDFMGQIWRPEAMAPRQGALGPLPVKNGPDQPAVPGSAGRAALRFLLAEYLCHTAYSSALLSGTTAQNMPDVLSDSMPDLGAKAPHAFSHDFSRGLASSVATLDNATPDNATPDNATLDNAQATVRGGSEAGMNILVQDYAEFLYHEVDWMLPQRRP